MKKILLASLLISGLSCSKESNKTCYECDNSVSGTGNYQSVGCFTKEEWNNYSPTDMTGNQINKDQRCRKAR